METHIKPKSDSSVVESLIAGYKAEIRQNISKHLPISKEGVDEIADAVQIRLLKAGTILLRAGQVAFDCCWIIKGCVRQYHLIEGEEKTTFFFTEDQWFASYTSATKKVPVNHYLSCVEDTFLSVMNINQEQELYQKYPAFESACRAGIENQLSDYHEMLTTYMTTTPEERYRNLLKTRPDLLSRVPQYQLASYLGVKPESLSRIRKRMYENLQRRD